MSAGKLSVPGRFLATVEANRLLARGDKVLVAVSGGADSVCLLDLLRLAAKRYELSVSACHLNHGLRAAAGRDEASVRELCASWQVPLEVGHADVAAHARRHKLGIEEAGRKLRYRWFDSLADRHGYDRIALGHTASDNLETMLMNLVRGTGPNGLEGIAVRRGRYIRPLLDIERRALVRHLAARGISWVEDESNKDVAFRRNRLRSEVVPVLESLNPQAARNARRTARLVAAEGEFLDSLAAEALERAAKRERGRTEIDTRVLADYNACLKRRVIKQLLPELDADGVERVLSLMQAGKAGRLSLTRGIRGRLQRGIITFERTKELPDDGR